MFYLNTVNFDIKNLSCVTFFILCATVIWKTCIKVQRFQFIFLGLSKTTELDVPNLLNSEFGLVTSFLELKVVP